MKNTIFCICLFCLFSLPAQAQVYNCDGRWTNKPCAGNIAGVIKEEPAVSKVPSAAAELSEKKSILHELNMRAIDVKRKYALRYDVGEVEKLCYQEGTSLVECRAVAARMTDRIDRKVADLTLVEAQERANRLQEEANKLRQERNEIEANKPDVVVIEEDEHIYRRRHQHPPVYEPGPFKGFSSPGASVNVSVHGVTSGGTNISAAGQAGGSVINLPGDSDHNGPRDGKGGHWGPR
jgi:hypothetical protein